MGILYYGLARFYDGYNSLVNMGVNGLLFNELAKVQSAGFGFVAAKLFLQLV